MASFVVQVSPVFQPGQTLKAYPASNWPAAQLPPALGSAPVGSATESQTISGSGTATFTTLTAGTEYYLTVDGSGQYLRAMPPVTSESVSGTVSSAAEGTGGSAVPLKVTLVGGSDGTNLRAFATDAAGVVKTDIAGQDVDVSVKVKTVSSATVTQVPSSAASVTLIASNAARRGLLVFNDSTAVLRLKYGTTASATDYTVKIPADGYWEMPSPIYSGRIDSIWAAANGNAYVTETV